MTQSEKLQLIKAQQKALQAELIELKKGTPTLKMEKNKRVEIGEKGTINVYGLGRFPVCLYMSQLINLQNIINSKEFAQFILDNSAKIAVKTEV
jgi:hypothetical protein